MRAKKVKGNEHSLPRVRLRIVHDAKRGDAARDPRQLMGEG